MTLLTLERGLASPPRMSRCAHCAARAVAPCGAVGGPTGLVDLERAHEAPRRIAADHAIYEQGATAVRGYTITHGWAAVTHTRSDGETSIVRFALPGDMLPFDRSATMNRTGAVALGDVIVCAILPAQQARLEARYPAFEDRARAAEARLLSEAYATLTATLARSAEQRVSQLLLSLATRSLRRRPADGDWIVAPLMQIQIGQATGLTAVHVSRVMRRLREAHVAELKDQRLTIFSRSGLERRAGLQSAEREGRA